MALVTVRSNLITNIVAVPPVQNIVTLENARKRASAAVVSVTNGDSIGSIYKLARVMSHWRLVNLRVFNGAVTSAAANLGLYRTDADGGAVVSAACYAAAVSLAAATTTGTEMLFAARTVDKLTALVWQDAGLTVDPRLAYDVCFTLTAAATATGFVAMDLDFCID